MRLRYLLGRRLVREDHYEEAAKFLPPPWDQMLARYVAALQAGHDKTRPAEERARALFNAAWLARFDGLELMGTEGAPDGFVNGGAFPMPDLATQLRSKTYERTSYESAEPRAVKMPTVLQLTAEERRRLTKSKPAPDLRYHYRPIAAALALQAAALLPNESEELADVLNRAGFWVKDEDEKMANRCYNILEKRAAKTVLGQAVIARHWFIDQAGTWSEAAGQAELALRQELRVPTAQ